MNSDHKKELWGDEFWEDGYYVCTVGDKVTAEVIREYVRYHREQERSPPEIALRCPAAGAIRVCSE
jgi:putative transposase